MTQRTSTSPDQTNPRDGARAQEPRPVATLLREGYCAAQRQTSVIEFYDIAADDEPGDQAASVASENWDEQKVQSISAGLDFLGSVENKKLVPAVSAFRRMLKKSARNAARHKEKETKDATKAQTSQDSTMPGLQGKSSRRQRRRQSSWEKSRERQPGSMDEAAERLGEASHSRRMTAVESSLAVVPEEDDVKSDSCEACEACEAEASEAANPQVGCFQKAASLRQILAETGAVEPRSPASSTEGPRKRFSLPLWRRKTSSCGSLTGTDSEDSMSSAGISDSSRPSPAGRRTKGSTSALDAILERARVAKKSYNLASHTEGSLSTTASSQGSSPRFVAPLERGVLESPKPTVAGAAWVLMQLCKQDTQETCAQEPERPLAETQVVSTTQSFKSSAISTEAFKFCFPQDICGVPLEPKSAAKESDRWRRGRRKAAA